MFDCSLWSAPNGGKAQLGHVARGVTWQGGPKERRVCEAMWAQGRPILSPPAASGGVECGGARARARRRAAKLACFAACWRAAELTVGVRLGRNDDDGHELVD